MLFGSKRHKKNPKSMRGGRKYPKSFKIDWPPHGVVFERNENGWRIVSVTRSLHALYVVPLVTIWASIGMLFSFGLILGGDFSLVRLSMGTLIFLAVIGKLILFSPFVIGHIEIRCDRTLENDGHIFKGIGRLGLTQRFRWSDVIEIEEASAKIRSNATNLKEVVLRRQEKDIRFGWTVSSVRRRYLILALNYLLDCERSRP